MSETIVEKGKSGEFWRVTVGQHSEIYDHEPTAGELTLLRQSLAAARQRAQAASLMRVSDRPGKLDGAATGETGVNWL